MVIVDDTTSDQYFKDRYIFYRNKYTYLMRSSRTRRTVVCRRDKSLRNGNSPLYLDDGFAIARFELTSIAPPPPPSASPQRYILRHPIAPAASMMSSSNLLSVSFERDSWSSYSLTTNPSAEYFLIPTKENQGSFLPNQPPLCCADLCHFWPTQMSAQI